jgi:hypothetical protein
LKKHFIEQLENQIIKLLVKYEVYLSMHITDVDVDLLITPHKTVNIIKATVTSTTLKAEFLPDIKIYSGLLMIIMLKQPY